MTHSSTSMIKNPGHFSISDRLRNALVVFAMIGVATFLAGLRVDPDRIWASFLLNHFYFMSLGLGGIFFASIQWVTGAMWSAPVRRLSEALSAYLPVVAVSFAILCFGIPHLYLWSHPQHVQGDLVLQGKSGYLSSGFFMVRNFLAIAIWLFLTHKMVRNSIAQDQDGNYKWTAKNRVLAPGFLILFGVTFTMASFDQLMSLDPHWFSTMFGIYCFSGLFYTLHLVAFAQLRRFLDYSPYFSLNMHILSYF